MHHFIRASDIRPVPAFAGESSGYRRFSLSDRDCGAVHSGWGLAELDAEGHVNQHLQSFEKSFYVLEGNPVLVLDNRAWRLAPGACGLIPIGMKQAWLGPATGTAKWILAITLGFPPQRRQTSMSIQASEATPKHAKTRLRRWA